MSRQFHYVLVYDEESNSWRLETYEAGDGDIWDNDEQEWRWADDEVTPTGEEPDLLYESE